MNTQKTNEVEKTNKAQETIAALAKRYLYLDTLETQNSDSLDFHDLAVWRIKEALEEAYKAGFEAGRK